MDAADWKKLKKIDAHIHIIPDEVHRANPDAEDVWVYADLERYRAVMTLSCRHGGKSCRKGGHHAAERSVFDVDGVYSR